MKKIVLILCVILANSNKHLPGKFCSCCPDETENTYAHRYENRTPQKETFKFFQKDLEKQSQQFIENGDTKAVNALLKKLDAKTKKYLLSKQITISYLGQKAYITDLLNFAITYENLEITKILINHGALLDVSAEDGFSPLTRAVSSNLPQIIEFLVKHGANINACDANGKSALYRAIKDSHATLIPLLVKLGAQINFIDNDGFTPLTIAIDDNNEPMVRALIKNGADVTMADVFGATPIHVALYNNNYSVINTLLEYQVNINVQDSNGNTPLHIAIEKSYDDLIPLFMNHNADVTIENHDYLSPAALALFYGKNDIAKFLFDSPQIIHDNIRRAIDINDIKAFNVLLNTSKTDPFIDKQNIINFTFDALITGNKEIIDVCIIKNKNFMKTSISGIFPIHYATMHGHQELLRYFIDSHQVDINQTDDYGFTPLHYACMYGNYEMVEYLANKKCLINIKTTEDLLCYKKGSTPCDIALQAGNTDIVDFLLKQHATMNFSYKNNIKKDRSMYLSLFVDSEAECTNGKKHIVSINRAFSQKIREIIKQKACPMIIIGQHMLHNALQLSCTLEDWLITEFSEENIDGYILVPKKLIDTSLPSLSKNSMDTKMYYLGFSLSQIQHEYLNEECIKQKKYPEKTINEKDFNALMPKILDLLLIPRERCIYWGGHGNIVGDGTIAGISRDNASSLFTILAKKHTNFLYVSSCFFSGKNYKAVNDIGNMIVISAATTEITISQRQGTFPTNWSVFFNALANYNNRDNSKKSFQSDCDYFANTVVPNLITHSPDITNFPHIKFPEKPFTLLSVNNQATLLDDAAVAKLKINTPVILKNQRLLEVTISHVKNMIEISKNIPLVVSDISKNIFEKIRIDINKDDKNNDLVGIFKQLTLPNLFRHSTLENTFLIKELLFSTRIPLTKKDTCKTIIPQTVYNVAIKREPGTDSCIFFSINKNPSPQNSFFLLYDVKNNQWNVVTNTSENDFVMYQYMLK